jgi:hypothetical protein
MNMLPKEVTELITGTAVTGQPWSLRCRVVEPVLDQHRRGHCCCRQKTILAAGGRVGQAHIGKAPNWRGPSSVGVVFAWQPASGVPKRLAVRQADIRGCSPRRTLQTAYRAGFPEEVQHTWQRRSCRTPVIRRPTGLRSR